MGRAAGGQQRQQRQRPLVGKALIGAAVVWFGHPDVGDQRMLAIGLFLHRDAQLAAQSRRGAIGHQQQRGIDH